jgi:hypothetical protein
MPWSFETEILEYIVCRKCYWSRYLRRVCLTWEVTPADNYKRRWRHWHLNKLPVQIHYFMVSKGNKVLNELKCITQPDVYPNAILPSYSSNLKELSSTIPPNNAEEIFTSYVSIIFLLQVPMLMPTVVSHCSIIQKEFHFFGKTWRLFLKTKLVSKSQK